MNLTDTLEMHSRTIIVLFAFITAYEQSSPQNRTKATNAVYDAAKLHAAECLRTMREIES